MEKWLIIYEHKSNTAHTEEKFILWWNKKNISYNNYFYELACYVWDVEQSKND